MDEQQQEIQYKVVIDRSDLHQAVDEVERATAQMAGSVSALSSNMLTNAAQAQAGSMYGPTGFMPGSALAPGMMSAYMYSQQSPGGFAPGAALAQDAFMQQAMLAGPSPMGFGPAMTTPFGDPTINLFRNTAGAPPFQVPLDFLSNYAPPGAPGDPRRSRLVFGTGEGSLFDLARIGIGKSLFGEVANDNLEDRMHRSIERRMQYTAENMTDVERFLATEFAMGLGGAAAGGALGSAVLGPAGTIAGSIIGGVAGSGVGAGLNATVGRLSRPYEEMQQSFSQYTAPFIRGERLGGGMSHRERLQSQRDIAKRVAADNWFSTKEYQDLINIAGESGVFQFSGSEDRAMEALDKLGSSVKTLYALGMKSRDMLKTIDQSLGTFGINPGTDPQTMANFFQTMASTAQSAGMSSSRLTDLVAPAAQMFASQGIGMQAGARIAAQNYGFAGEMFRRGGMGAFENAYFGGIEGLGQTLTQATATMYRTPVGQALLSSLFAPGGNNLQRMIAGDTLSVTDIVRGAGGYVSDPLRYIGMQALMPKMTQELGPELQGAMLNTLTKTFREMFGEQGQIDPERFLGFMVQMGIPENQAMALYQMIGSAGTTAEGIRHSARDQAKIARIEALRGPTLGRRFEKLRQRTVDQWADNFMTGLTEFNANVMKGVNEMITGVHIYDVGEDGRSVLQSPFEMRASMMQADKWMQEHGFSTTLFSDSIEDGTRNLQSNKRELLTKSREQLISDLLSNDPAAERRFIEAAKAQGISSRDIESYLAIAKGSGPAQVALSNGARNTIQSVAEQVTGKTGRAAEIELAQNPELRKQVAARVRARGITEAEVEAYAGNGMVIQSRGSTPSTVAGAIGQASGIALPREVVEDLSRMAQQITGKTGQDAIEALRSDDAMLKQLEAMASASGPTATDRFLNNARALRGDISPAVVAAFVGKPIEGQMSEELNRIMSHAAASEGLTTEDIVQGGISSNIRDLLLRDPSANRRAKDLRQQMIKDGRFTNEEIAEYFGETKSPAEMLGFKHQYKLSPERAAELEAEFGKVMDESRAMKARNIDLISGIKAAHDDTDTSFTSRARSMADSLMVGFGADQIKAKINLTAGSEEDNFRSFAKMIYNKDYGELSMSQKAMVGGTMKFVSDSLGQGDAASKVLRDTVDGAKAATKSDIGATMEQLETSRKEALGELDGDIRAALEVGGTERMENMTLVQQMAIQQMAEESGGNWDEFKKKLKNAGISDRDFADLGIDQGLFESNYGEFVTSYARRVDDAIASKAGGQNQRLTKAQAKIKQRGLFGIGDIDETNVFKQARALQDNAMLQADLSAIALDEDSRSLVIQRLGKDTIGSEKADDLLRTFNQRKGDDLSGISRLAEALGGDVVAQDKLGVTESYISDIKGAVGDIERGRSLNVETLTRIIQQGQPGIKEEEAKAMAEQYRASIQTKLDKNDVSGARQQVGDLLRSSMVHATTKGDGYMGMSGKELTGGLMGPEAMKGLTQAIAQQNRIADQLEKIAKNFNPTSSDSWVEQVKSFKEAVVEDGGFVNGTKAFTSAVEKFEEIPEKIKKAIEQTPTSGGTVVVKHQENENLPGRGARYTR